MKYLIYLLAIFMLQGCLYFNDRGISGHLYDNCHSYYDGDGNFIEECDENLIDYGEAKEGVIAIKDEIAQTLTHYKQDEVSQSQTSGIDINTLSIQEQNILLEGDPELIKEEDALIQSHCK